MSDDEWLVGFDTDRIKEYLFATNKLKEIRGASALLVELNHGQPGRMGRTEAVARRVCPDAETVYADGGGALFIVPSEDIANAVIAAVEKLYREESVIATITGACLPLAPATRDQGFGKRVHDLGFLLGRNKARKATLSTQPVAPYVHQCDACGRHPAAHRLTDMGQDQLLCRACTVKRNNAPSSDPTEPSDFEDLGELSHPAGYLGFIYADGNLMGHRLQQLGSRDAYLRFSHGLMNCMKSALREATRRHAPSEGKKPYVELLLGGDDLLLVTAADLALPIAHDLARNFEESSVGLLDEVGIPNDRLTLSVGVVLAHVDYPIAELLRLADKRLKTAKQRSFREGYRTGAVDFEIVTSAVAREDQRRPYRDKRPYTLADLDKLLGYARDLHDFPTSQLQAMYESLHRPERHAASLTCLLALVRTRGRDRQLALRKFFVWSGSMTPPWSPPWCSEDRHTALGDLVEILPFVTTRR